MGGALMRLRVAMIVVASLAAVMAAGCDGGGGEGDPTATRTARGITVTPTATPRPPPSTGIDVVDEIIAAHSSNDPAAIAALVRYASLPCVANPQGEDAPPICRGGAPEGTPVDVIRVATCESYWAEAVEVLRLISSVPLQRTHVYAVHRAAGDAFPRGEYVITLSRPLAQGIAGDAGWQLVVGGDGIVALTVGCTASPAEVIAEQGLTDVIVPPPGE